MRIGARTSGVWVAVFLVAACGTRVDRALVPAYTSTSVSAAPGAEAGPTADASGAASARPPAGATVPDPALPSAGPAGRGGSGSRPGWTAPPSGHPGTQSGGDGGSGAAEDSRQSLPAPPGPPVPPTGSARKSPVVLAQVGTFSGPIGEVFQPTVKTLQMWAKLVNRRGGLNGHEIRLVTFDDGGDPARHRAQVQEAIERNHAIAFVANVEGVAGAGSVEYLRAQRVPVIGSEGGQPYFYTSPMHFPQASHYDAMFYGGMAGPAQALVEAKQTKIGLLVCVESPLCSDGGRVWSETAPGLGLTPVYQAKISLGQPDFTAECLRARNAGADALYVLMDPSSITRLMTSCTRQGFRPRIATTAALASNRHLGDPNLDGMLVGSMAFPLIQSGTPATDEWQLALRTYGQGITPTQAMPPAWVAAKLVEKAAAALTEPPTSQSILDGLWSIENDTLGGLTQPLTFVRDQPAQPRACWFNLTIAERAWVSPDKGRVNCQRPAA